MCVQENTRTSGAAEGSEVNVPSTEIFSIDKLISDTIARARQSLPPKEFEQWIVRFAGPLME